MLKDIKFQTVHISVPAKNGRVVKMTDDGKIYESKTTEMLIKPSRSLSAMEDLIEEIYKKKDKYFMENATDPDYLIINQKDYKVLVWYLSNERGSISLIDSFLDMEIIIRNIGIPEVIGTASEELMNLHRE